MRKRKKRIPKSVKSIYSMLILISCILMSVGYATMNASNLKIDGDDFTNTNMIDGKGYQWTTEVGTTITGMPTFDGTGTMNGNDGAGHAKITLLELT